MEGSLNYMSLDIDFYFKHIPFEHLFETVDITDEVIYFMWHSLLILNECEEGEDRHIELAMGSKVKAIFNDNKGISFENFKFPAHMKKYVRKSGDLKAFFDTWQSEAHEVFRKCKFPKTWATKAPSGWRSHFEKRASCFIPNPIAQNIPLKISPGSDDEDQVQNQREIQPTIEDYRILQQDYSNIMRENSFMRDDLANLQEEVRQRREESRAYIMRTNDLFKIVVTDLVAGSVHFPFYLRNCNVYETAYDMIKEYGEAIYGKKGRDGLNPDERAHELVKVWNNMILADLARTKNYDITETIVAPVKDPQAMIKECVVETMSSLGISGSLSQRLDHALSFAEGEVLKRVSSSIAEETLVSEVDKDLSERAKILLAKTSSKSTLSLHTTKADHEAWLASLM